MIEYLNLEKFLNKKADLYNFINPFFDEKYLRSHNFFYILNALFIYRNYFDNLYLKFDPNIKLDMNQRMAILSQNKNTLIIAGAGSGKTTTVAAKIKFMVEILKIDPNEILLLSYTNEAVNEMQKIICNCFGIEVKILTFHKFAILLTQNKKEIVDNGADIQFVNKLKLSEKIRLFSYLYLFYDLKILDIFRKNSKLINAVIDFSNDCNKRKYERLIYKRTFRALLFK